MSPSPSDPGLDNLDREIAAAKAHTLIRDERYFWEHRAQQPERPVIVFDGAEKWKQAPIAAGELVLCEGCEVKPPHYHEKEG